MKIGIAYLFLINLAKNINLTFVTRVVISDLKKYPRLKHKIIDQIHIFTSMNGFTPILYSNRF